MSIERATCYVVTCDVCRTSLGEDAEGYTMHFRSHDEALRQIADDGWTVTEDGQIQCYQCTRDTACKVRGHTWGEWTSCWCQGRPHMHSERPCSRIRFCDRCGSLDTPVAYLPTTAEPTAFRNGDQP